MELHAKVAIVTGAAKGIGAAIAHTFVCEGAAVVVADVDASAGQALADTMTAANGRALFVHTNVAWAYDHVLPRLQVQRKVKRAVIHPTCSTEHLGLSKTLLALATALADTAIKPTNATCCGFAEDRGFLHPELAHAATYEEAAEVRQQPYDAYLCSNRTCEVGMHAATGQRYQSVIFCLKQPPAKANPVLRTVDASAHLSSVMLTPDSRTTLNCVSS